MGRINSMLMLDTTSPQTATTVATAIPGGAGVEVAFLTSIPMSCIYKYKESKSKIWRKMPSA